MGQAPNPALKLLRPMQTGSGAQCTYDVQEELQAVGAFSQLSSGIDTQYAYGMHGSQLAGIPAQSSSGVEGEEGGSDTRLPQS